MSSVSPEMMSRPEWLASEGHVFFGLVSEKLMDHSANQIKQKIDNEQLPCFTKYDDTENDVFDALYNIGRFGARLALEAPIIEGLKIDRLPVHLGRALREYTFGGEYYKPFANLTEGIHTMWLSPANLAQEAQAAGADIKTLEDVARFYKKQSFKKVLGQCALTANGFWGSWSNRPTSGIGFRYTGEPFVQVDQTEEIKLEPMLAKKLRQHYASTNNSDNANSHSSGCPVRHKGPKYNPENEMHASSVAYMSEMFDLEPEEILERKSDSPIDRMLELEADIIERIAAHEESHYLVSSRMNF